MSTVELRTDLHNLIDQLDDRFLKAVHSMVSVYHQSGEDKQDPIIGYESDGSPLKASTFIEQADVAVAAAKAGEGISAEELETRSKQWLEHIA